MAYKRTYSKRDVELSAENELSLDLDKKKAVSVRLFNGISLVDIREFYIDATTKERKPGKKGISLTAETWKKLLELQQEISDALERLESKKQKTEDKEEPKTTDSTVKSEDKLE